jgi:hypothetical protein
MKHLPITPDLQPATEFPDRRSKTLQTSWDRLVAAITNPGLAVAIILGITACLIAVKLMQLFPDAGLTIEQFNEFL